MVLLGQTSNESWTLDYDKVPLQKVQFLSIVFYGDVLFELLPILLTTHNPSQLQGIDRKYDGHAWSKLVITNIKNSFGLNFKKAHCLGHCGVCKMIVKILCVLSFAMKHFGVMSVFIFQS
jgi:hypothetical protein